MYKRKKETSKLPYMELVKARDAKLAEAKDCGERMDRLAYRVNQFTQALCDATTYHEIPGNYRAGHAKRAEVLAQMAGPEAEYAKLKKRKTYCIQRATVFKNLARNAEIEARKHD